MATEGTKPAVSAQAQEAAQQQLNPQQIENVKTIIQVGKDNNIPRQGIKIALMTAQQESTLLNLDHGDRDSLGLFQQRPSAGWGSPEQIQDPIFAAKSFYGVNPEVSPNGLLQIQGWENMAPGDAAQAVQVSAFPDAYAKWDGMAEDLLNQYY
nr:peptidoglycan-binding protein [Brevibacterium ravenspurgense]